jgi:archaemetzincin
MGMGIHIFWDRQAPDGLQIPVAKLIEGICGIPAEITGNPVVLNGYTGGRRQVDAGALLGSLGNFMHLRHIHEPVLLVVGQDMFAPGFDFVFGLARPRTMTSVVSSARLSNEYYGRFGSDEDLTERIAKEGCHEIGHIFGLAHCPDHECIMFNPHSLDDLDGKKKEFCPACQAAFDREKASGLSVQ